MANRVRFVDNVSVSAFGNTGGGGSSVSSSYAETASFAQSGNGNFSGSFSGSFQGDGSNLTGIDPFPFSGSAVITGSLVVSGSNDGIYSPNQIKAESIFRLGDDAFFRASPAILHLGLGSSTCAAISTERDCIQFRTSTATGFGGIIPFEIHDNYIELNSPVTASGNVSSSAASTASFGTYLGDGSQLTGIDPFPFSGSAVITGSLVVSGSSKPLEVIGSGSTVFSVVGSLGELFAIDDQLSGSLLVVNDISGLPQFEVFSDGRTLIGADPRSLYTTATISSTTAATSQSIYSLSTSSYDRDWET
jgi:hypothetical protein